MANLNFPEKIRKATSRLKSKEQMLGSGLLQPFNSTNSGARKLMHSVHRTHVFSLMKGEKAIVETGYEIRFGDESSSITQADSDYRVIGKISKFQFAPNHHYWLIVQDTKTGNLDCIERISYKHITESYGYLYNNQYVDRLIPGSYIPENDIVQKSLAFDEYNNRQDGVNLNVAYIALDDNMEDSVIFSDAAAAKMTAPLIKPVKIMINENDIPLNMYGDDVTYKAFPDIGEEIKDGILLGLRKEKKEEALFMQSVDRLKKTIMSDEKYKLHGTVIDVNIYCNNPDNLDSLYNGQFKMYYEELQRQSREIVQLLTPFVAQGVKMSYELEKLFANSKRVINKDQYIEKRQFSNMVIEIVVLEQLPLNVGDKTSNRFGGKGIVSYIRPQHLMPKFNNEYVDVILNSSTMYNRENPGQLFELSATHIGCEILEHISKGGYSPREAAEMIAEYIECFSISQASELRQWLINLSDDDVKFFVETVIDDGAIHISTKPMSESMDIDRLNYMYQKFPFVKQFEIDVPITDSNGNIRYVKARRSIVVGKQYMFRLKQFAEEKFSATSLSATNIRNENTKSKASRDFKDLYSNTPIRAGNMEIDNENHIGAEHVVTNLMLHSTSPHGRRLVEQFYTGDPFKIDIKLDNEASNRSAEIVNTYLKTRGYRLKFVKVAKKKIVPMTINPIFFKQNTSLISPIFFNDTPGFDFVKDFFERQNNPKPKTIRPMTIDPLKFTEPQ